MITNLHCTLLLVGWCTSYTQYTINLSAVHKHLYIYIKVQTMLGSSVRCTRWTLRMKTHTSALAFYAIRVQQTAKSGPHRVITIIIMYCIVFSVCVCPSLALSITLYQVWVLFAWQSPESRQYQEQGPDCSGKFNLAGLCAFTAEMVFLCVSRSAISQCNKNNVSFVDRRLILLIQIGQKQLFSCSKLNCAIALPKKRCDTIRKPLTH